MKKNITRILERLKKGNIRPKDRIKLLIADMVSQERDGKALLTEAERYALSDGWIPKNNEEIKEYNRFYEGWKNAAYAEMDAETIYLNATTKLLRASKYISFVLYKNRFTKENKTIREELANKIIDDLKGDFNFVNNLNLREQQADVFKILNVLILFLREHRFTENYSTLLAFELLFKELSKSFETDLTYSIKEWIRKFRKELELFTMEFLMLADDITEAKYKSNINKLLVIPFNPDKVKPDMKGRVKVYADKIKDILQDDFKNPFNHEK